jgi:hypothetical protein
MNRIFACQNADMCLRNQLDERIAIARLPTAFEPPIGMKYGRRPWPASLAKVAAWSCRHGATI